MFFLFFLQTDTVSCVVATSRLYVTVSYGSCMVAASDLYSTVSYGGAVQTPGAMCTCRGCTISQQNRVVRTSAFGCLNWAGSISFVRTFEEVTSGLLRFFFFGDFGNRTNVTSLIGFFCTRTYTREIWRASRGVLIHAPGLSRNRSRSLHVRACMCV